MLFMRDSFFDKKDIRKSLPKYMDHFHRTYIRKEQKSQRTVLEGLSVIRNSARSRNRAAENIQDKEKRNAGEIVLPVHRNLDRDQGCLQ
jgi:hypothetical protein